MWQRIRSSIYLVLNLKNKNKQADFLYHKTTIVWYNALWAIERIGNIAQNMLIYM